MRTLRVNFTPHCCAEVASGERLAVPIQECERLLFRVISRIYLFQRNEVRSLPTTNSNLWLEDVLFGCWPFTQSRRDVHKKDRHPNTVSLLAASHVDPEMRI